MTRDMLAFDLGASNGRAVLARFDGDKLALSELHRFPNALHDKGGLSYWDAGALFAELKEGFHAYSRDVGGELSSFGIDTWGVDYGLLDAGGGLIGDPRAYRTAVDDDMDLAWQRADKRGLFARTGIAAMSFNTVYQLYRRVRENDEQLASAHTLLLMPDLLGYFFTGDKLTEYTNATTTNLLAADTASWDGETLRLLDIPARIFTAVDFPGTLRSPLKTELANELGLRNVRLAAVGTHDTASAVAAIPGEGSFAFCSSGTWSLFGVETEKPMLTDAVFAANFSNEGTVQGGFRPLKNIMGLWIIQECRREWAAEGKAFSWDELVRLAKREAPFRSVIDPDDAPFFKPGAMLQKIRVYCQETGQIAPETEGQFARCVYESLALKYRHALEMLETIKGRRIDTLNIVGGGSQNGLLNQMAADATGRTVVTGPIEGASAGNALMQAQALGEIRNIAEAREVIRRSFPLTVWEPRQTQAWQDAYARLLRYMEVKKHA